MIITTLRQIVISVITFFILIGTTINIAFGADPERGLPGVDSPGLDPVNQEERFRKRLKELGLYRDGSELIFARPDFTITNASVNVADFCYGSPSLLKPSTAILKVTAKVANKGSLAAPSAGVQYAMIYAGDQHNLASGQWGNGVTFGTIQPSSGTVVSWDIPLGATPPSHLVGRHSIVLTVDPRGQWQETNENNNKFKLEVDIPDWVIIPAIGDGIIAICCKEANACF